MTSAVLICRCKSKIAFLNYAVVAAMPFFFLGASLFGLYLHGWRMFFAAFPFAVLTAVIACAYRSERSRLKRSSLEIDIQRGVLTFRHFRFIATFLPEPPRKEEIVRFDQILGFQEVEVHKGIFGVRVRTHKGTVTISEEMEHFEAIVAALSEVVSTNQSRPAQFQSMLKLEPKIQTAWYGWVILLAAVALVMFVGWKVMYAE